MDFKSEVFEDDATIISGCAPGADTLAIEWAENNYYQLDKYPAKWDDLTHPDAIIAFNKWGKPYNKNAGFTRNRQMLVEGKPDLVIAFAGGAGTENMVTQATSEEFNVKVIRVRRKIVLPSDV